MQLQIRQQQEAREAAGRVFDAITASGKDGLAQLGQTFIKSIERQIFVNVSSIAFEQSRKAMSNAIPGQVDKNGNLTTVGKILQGTPFGKDPVQLAMDLNAKSHDRNTLAVERLTTSISQQNASMAHAIPTLIDRSLLRTPGFAPDGLTDPKIRKVIEENTESQKKGASYLEKIASSKYLGIGSTAAIGAVGAAQGFGRGGAQGVLQGAASVASTVGTVLPMLSKTLSLAGPIGMIAGLGLSLVSGFLPNAKEKFDRSQDAALNKNRNDAPTARNADFDLATGGRSIYDDVRGGSHVVQNITVNISALDARSLESRGADIAEVVGDAVRAGQSPKMSQAIWNTVAPGA